MPEEAEKIPLDARLLSDAIIELNISRRNVSIYPRDHPSVEKSLSRAFNFLQKLFEIRPEITLAVAKETLIIDDYYLDRKNPVYREFALNLSRMNIAYVTFVTGLTKDELYEFHKLISEKPSDTSVEAVKELFQERNMVHIRAGFIDYGAFSFEEGKFSKETTKGLLWERYVYGLLEGTLQGDEISSEVSEIPPEVLAQLINKESIGDLKEETYDRVITTYMKRSSEAAFSSEDMKRLMDFINGLKPELKKQFLSSAVRTVSKDMDSAYKALGGISADEVIDLLNAINDQKVAMPESLKNLLDRLSKLPQDGTDSLSLDGSLIVDDIFISPDIVNLFSGNFESFVSGAYQKEIQKILAFRGSAAAPAELTEAKREFNDDYIEKDFNHIVLELLASEGLSEDDYKFFLDILKEQIDQFIWTGQYGQILRAFKALESNVAEHRFAELSSGQLVYYHSPEFVSKLVDSFRMLGRQMREDAWLLCEYYSERIIPVLIDALIDETSQTTRRFLMGLLLQFGEKILPESIKRLGDSRWFVKRNMLYLLGECHSKDALPHVRPYCRHENRKVSFEAIKCLLNSGDSYGIEALKESLLSESRESVEQAIALAGTFRIKEVVNDMVRMLKRRGISGADLYDKIPLVKALGEIGDPRAVGALRELLSGKSILFKQAAEKLREEIYRSLRHYPYEDVRELIEAGIKSKNEYIREESLRLSKGGG
jgi:HEAT repeat protein